MVDPQHFNPSTAAYYKLIVGMFFGTGLIKMCVYLQAHPVPEVKTVTTVQTVEKQKSPPVVITKTVETTETAPKEGKE